MTNDASILFSPFKLGDLQLNNRLVMAPLTRNWATKGTDAPNDLNARYYRQRATAGLIISEATPDQSERRTVAAKSLRRRIAISGRAGHWNSTRIQLNEYSYL
jgi:2,4-dienoyl-CoA reductase-like NADH-dependent reductase (Old Yellow Enzyme family)